MTQLPPKIEHYLDEARKCDEAAAEAPRVDVSIAYKSLAKQWRTLALQATGRNSEAVE
jgi:hypothetical protein